MNIFKKRKNLKYAKKMTVGVNSLSKAADKIKLLDKVLSLFGMKVGSDMMEIDATSGRILGIRLTVYFVK
jgi:hypothetical protein